MREKIPKEESFLTADDIRIFISHSARDQIIAEALVELLKNGLEIDPKSIRCTSVPGHGLRGGVRADDALRYELLKTYCFIGLLTPDSLKSTYVLFELGARWGADLHLLPLLASGLQPKHLKGPLVGINAHSCSSAAQLHQMI
ncbi:MAG TPA: toll/interleukin-1 receptor domain-containing protein, partial [Candidatus Angelobacter sp.]